MTQHCEDCGTKMYDGICPNCQEELYIYEHQDAPGFEFSDDFMEKVKEQRAKQ